MGEARAILAGQRAMRHIQLAAQVRVLPTACAHHCLRAVWVVLVRRVVQQPLQCDV